MSWIEHIKEYSKKNNISYKDAMKDEDCKSSYRKMKSGGFIQSPFSIDTSIRRDYKPQIRDLLKKIGDKYITSITIQRVPIESTLKNVLNVLSLGTYNKQTQKLGYDKVFHLSMILTLQGIKNPIVVEKNEVINISTKIPPMKQGGARMSVPVIKKITLNQLLENTRSKQGSNFFLYDAFKRNCQMFINDLLTNSGLNNESVREFILQDAKKILEGLPSYFQGLSKGLTDLGAQLDTIIYGRGYRKGL